MERNDSAAPAADNAGGMPPEVTDLLVEGQDNPAGEADPVAETERAFALRMGWRDKDEHVAKGRPAHSWLSAKEYIEKQQREGPLLRSQLRKQDDTIARQERLLKEQGEALKEILERDRHREARGYDWARDNVKQRMRQAVADADTNAFAAAERELEELDKMKPVKEAKKESASNQPQQPDVETAAAFQVWARDNPWFSTDKALARAATAIEQSLMEDEPYLAAPSQTAERLRRVRDEVQKLHPHKFENAARNNPPAAARPGPQGVRPAAGKKTLTFDDIPAGEREAAKSAFAMIQRRTPSASVAQYVKDYMK